jgi:hypothetical protein
VFNNEDEIFFKFRDLPTDVEDVDMFVSDTPPYWLHPYKNDDVFGWEKIIKYTKMQVCVSYLNYDTNKLSAS